MAFLPILMNSLFIVVFAVCNFENHYTDCGQTKIRPHLWRQLSVENLANFVSLYATRHCLIILDNFQSIDLSLTHPAIIRTPTYLGAPDVRKIFAIFDHIFGPDNLVLNYSMSFRFRCPLSKHFASRLLPVRERALICYKLSLPDFLINTKSFNCLVQFELFPPPLYYKLYYHLSWHKHYEGEISRFAYLFPHTSYNSIQIILPEESLFNQRYLSKSMPDLAYLINPNLRHLPSHMYCGEVLVLAELTTDRLTSNMAQWLSTVPVRIASLGLIQLGKEWGDEYGSVMSLDKPLASMPSKLTQQVFPSSKYNLIWYLSSSLKTGGIISRMVHHLESCENTSHLKLFEGHSVLLERLARMYAQVWMTVMGNYTLRTEENEEVECSMGRVSANTKLGGTHINLVFRPYSKGSYYFPYFLYDDMNRLRFLTCGEKGINSIPFIELIKVFDKRIWQLILICSALLVVVLKLLPGHIRATGSPCLSPLTILLEQGNPYENSCETHTSMKILMGTFLMVAIQISNAYKSSNVYNMILPRTSIPYKYFQELHQENFTIFTRIMQLEPLVFLAEDHQFTPLNYEWFS